MSASTSAYRWIIYIHNININSPGGVSHSPLNFLNNVGWSNEFYIYKNCLIYSSEARNREIKSYTISVKIAFWEKVVF